MRECPWHQIAVSQESSDTVLCGHKHVIGPPPKDEEKWAYSWGIRFIFASDKSTDSSHFREITIDADGIKSIDV
jgi:hypothetical protein